MWIQWLLDHEVHEECKQLMDVLGIGKYQTNEECKKVRKTYEKSSLCASFFKSLIVGCEKNSN